MEKITYNQIMKFNPCYKPTDIKGITKKTKMTLFEIMRYPHIPDDDKVWVFSNFGTDLQRRVFAIWCARQIKTNSKKIKKYIDINEKHYIYGTATEEEMQEANRAA